MLANFVVNFLNTSLFTKLLYYYYKLYYKLLTIWGGGQKHCWPPNENWGASDPRFYRQRTPCTTWDPHIRYPMYHRRVQVKIVYSLYNVQNSLFPTHMINRYREFASHENKETRPKSSNFYDCDARVPFAFSLL